MSGTATTPSTQTAPVAEPKVRAIFAGLLVAMLLASLDQTIFSTALPTIVGELHGVDHQLWVTTAYLLASTITMPVYGKLGDALGRKGLFVAALSFFVVGSVVGALAQGTDGLILGRAVQGLGGGGLMILSQSIVADVVPARERGRYMGVIGSVFGLSSVVGPLLGGWFTEGPGWRWALWINVPLGLLAIAAAVVFLKPSTRRQRLRVDVAGIAVVSVAVTAFVLATAWGGTTYAWTSPMILGLATVCVVAGCVFVQIERRAQDPLIPLRLFADRSFNAATLCGLVLSIAMFGAISYLPTYFQMAVGVSATEAGLLLLPMIAGLMATALTTGQLISRTGRYRWMPIASASVTALGLLLLSTVDTSLALWVICAYLFVLGAGIGLGFQTLVLVVQNAFPSEVGTATAANSFFREIGASLGSAVVGSVFTGRLTQALGDQISTGATTVATTDLTPAIVRSLPAAVRDTVVAAYNEALMPVFLYLVPLAALGLVAAWLIQEKPLLTATTAGIRGGSSTA